jgi:hypothetical protein
VLLLVAVFFVPCWPELGSYFVGDGGDNYVFAFRYEVEFTRGRVTAWTPEALSFLLPAKA